MKTKLNLILLVVILAKPGFTQVKSSTSGESLKYCKFSTTGAVPAGQPKIGESVFHTTEGSMLWVKFPDNQSSSHNKGGCWLVPYEHKYVASDSDPGKPLRPIHCGNPIVEWSWKKADQQKDATTGAGNNGDIIVNVIDSSVTNIIVDGGGQSAQQPVYYDQPAGGGGFNLSINSGYGAYAPAMPYFQQGLPLPMPIFAALPLGPLPIGLPIGFGGYIQQQCPSCCSSSGGTTTIVNNYYTTNVVNNPPPGEDDSDPLPEEDFPNGNSSGGGEDDFATGGKVHDPSLGDKKAQKAFDDFVSYESKKSLAKEGSRPTSGQVADRSKSVGGDSRNTGVSQQQSPGKVSDGVQMVQRPNVQTTGIDHSRQATVPWNGGGQNYQRPGDVSRQAPQNSSGTQMSYQNPNRSSGQQAQSNPRPTYHGGHTKGVRPAPTHMTAPPRQQSGGVRPVNHQGYSKGGVSAPVRQTNPIRGSSYSTRQVSGARQGGNSFRGSSPARSMAPPRQQSGGGYAKGGHSYR